MSEVAVTAHDGIFVARDDLYPGGTKARFLPQLFDGADEVVYASPCQGGAQFALAHVAHALGKRATIFCAARGTPHPRQFEAKRLGAKVVLVDNGMLNVVQKRAKDYAQEVGARLAPFGMDLPEAIDVIAQAAHSTGVKPTEVWCSAGSGTLTRALQAAWPDAEHHAVAVGRDIPQHQVGRAQLQRYDRTFEQHARVVPPFPSDPHYDAKAWERCVEAQKKKPRRGAGLVLVWNVTGPAQP